MEILKDFNFFHDSLKLNWLRVVLPKPALPLYCIERNPQLSSLLSFHFFQYFSILYLPVVSFECNSLPIGCDLGYVWLAGFLPSCITLLYNEMCSTNGISYCTEKVLCNAVEIGPP